MGPVLPDDPIRHGGGGYRPPTEPRNPDPRPPSGNKSFAEMKGLKGAVKAPYKGAAGAHSWFALDYNVKQRRRWWEDQRFPPGLYGSPIGRFYDITRMSADQWAKLSDNEKQKWADLIGYMENPDGREDEDQRLMIESYRYGAWGRENLPEDIKNKQAIIHQRKEEGRLTNPNEYPITNRPLGTIYRPGWKGRDREKADFDAQKQDL